ncbi:hypothetical protein QWY31_03585 [Cytophagales bacterium LB-30]|uniref:DoxX family protein n=1 Tax=Shiella aurantiaca TaxID=3058365 RepID=A0ABT8F2C1_9BACT|nr:hypothetical protein [Shiella aurantiaca]MDN4164567.1 hypothetical protein [Shiella aurantiaca]
MKVLRWGQSATAIFLGFTFFGAGMAKLYAEHQFIGWIGPVWLIEQLEQYKLGLYAHFIALSQVVIGFTLLTPRFRSLGAVMLVPMLLNILLITISQQWTGTPYLVSILLGMNGFLLFMDAPKLLPLVQPDRIYIPSRLQKYTWAGHFIWLSGLLVVLGAIPLSFRFLHLSYGLVAGGLLLSFLSHKADPSFSMETKKAV